MRWHLLSLLSMLVVATGVAADDEPTQATAAVQPFAGRVTGNNVRLRLQPDLSAPVVDLLDEASLLVVLDEDDEFYSVSPQQGATAYIYRPYVLDGVVEGSHVNVRLEPDVEAPIVTQLNTGDQVVGEVCPTNSRWMQIAMPDTARLFVAKEYIEKVGAPELVMQHAERRDEVSKLLQSVFLASQEELGKPLSDVDVDAIKADFQRVGTEYPDFPEYATRANAVLEMIQQIYDERQLAAAQGLETEPIAELGLEILEELAMGSEQRTIDVPMASAFDHNPESALAQATPAVERSFATDKMLTWEPIETGIFQVWAMDHEEACVDQFYSEQDLDGVSLTGIIEAYDRPVRNRPGDFLLVQNHRPVAFLYSTRINLEDKVGQQVTIRGLPRPNHHFAFPAYFVLSVE